MIHRPTPALVRRSLFAIRNSQFAILLVISLLLAGCRPSAAPTFVPPPTANPVSGSTYTIDYGHIVETVEVRGRVAAKQEASLMFPVAGVLKDVHVLPGDQVEEGTLLAELDAAQIEETALTRRFDLQLTEIALLMAQLRLAQTGVPSVTISTDMTAREVLARMGLEQALLDLEVEMARLRVEKARALDVLSSERLSSTLFTAPFSGIIVSLDKGPGDQVRAYEPFGALADPSELWIIATVLEEDIHHLVREKSVTVRLDAYPEEEYSATVLQIPDQAIVWQNQNAYEVIITFDEGQEVPATIRMGANISIAGQSREDVLVVPTRAIITIGEQSYVEVTRDDGKIERVMVQTGFSNALETEIVAGLQPGQVVHIP